MSTTIGIITLTGGANYGNQLQHYAVVQILRNMGHQPETVRDTTSRGFADAGQEASVLNKLTPAYLSSVISSRLQYQYHRKNESDGCLKCILRERKRHAEFVASEKKRQERFDAFAERYLPFGSLTVNASQRPDEAAVAAYGAFVCGSDQVWNPTYRDTSPIRFASFAPKEKRIAISPSFGVPEIPEHRREAYKEYLTDMAFLSVRERNGQQIIRELTGREAPVLVDPTLMLTAAEWDAVSRKPEGNWEQPYLLTYFLGNKTRVYERAIRALAEKKHLRVVNLLEISEPDSYAYDPAEFLWLVKNAAFICTDSFHGTVFSILYHKDFYTFSRSESGFSKDSRVGTLLDKLGLQSCLYHEGDFVTPDYANADVLLEKERTRFAGYLANALSTACASDPQKYDTVGKLNAEDPMHCSGCSACAFSCPKGAISMVRNAEGFLYPSVDDSLCVKCGKCVSICKAASDVLPGQQTTAYACVNKNQEQRIKSSSGGVFILLAERMVADGGTVFGAALDERYRLRHMGASSMAELCGFMGSKYFQSDTADSFFRAKALLDEGKKVLFSGTPCQIGGLKAYLGREYSNLTTVDIICHGTPSQLAFDTYLSEHSRLGKLRSVSFRNKDKGWAGFSMKLCGEKCSYRQDLEHDPFLVAFLHNANLRESCYNCRFKTADRVSDITLADFWGVARILPEYDDDQGVSLVLTHSQKGEDLLSAVSDRIRMEEVNADTALKNNSAALHSVLRPNARNDFYRMIRTEGFDSAVKTLYPITVKKQIGFLKEKVYKIYVKLK